MPAAQTREQRKGGTHMSVPVKKKRRDPVPGDLWDRGLTPPDLL